MYVWFHFLYAASKRARSTLSLDYNTCVSLHGSTPLQIGSVSYLQNVKHFLSRIIQMTNIVSVPLNVMSHCRYCRCFTPLPVARKYIHYDRTISNKYIQLRYQGQHYKNYNNTIYITTYYFLFQKRMYTTKRCQNKMKISQETSKCSPNNKVGIMYYVLCIMYVCIYIYIPVYNRSQF